MPEPFLLKKALDLSATSLGKSTSAVIKGLLVLTAIGFLVIGVKSCIKKPLPTLTQTADTIVSPTYNLQPRAFGCARLIVQGNKK